MASLLTTHAQMTNCKPICTLMDTKDRKVAIDGTPFEDLTRYRRFVGALQYLTFTGPLYLIM